MNCADNTGAKNLFILSVKGIKVCIFMFHLDGTGVDSLCIFAIGSFE
jgi:ribosomal protein L14